MRSQANHDPNRLLALASMIIIGIAGAFITLALPMLVGTVGDTFELSDGQVGWIASAEMAGMTVSTLAITLRIRQWNRRYIAMAYIGVAIAGNVAAMLSQSFEMILVSRAVTGLGEGGLMAVMSAGIADTDHPERNYSYFLISNFLIGTIGFKLLAPLVAAYQANGVFVFLLVLCLIASPFVLGLPPRPTKAQAADPQHASVQPVNWVAITLGLAGILVYFSGLGGIWAYMERIGRAADVSSDAVANALSIAAIAGMFGALAAAALGNRLGRAPSLAVGAGAIAVAVSVLASSPATTAYMMAAAAFMFSWLFSVPYIVGAMAALDPTGRAVVLNMAMQFIGLSIGPSALGIIISGGSYSAAIASGGVACAAGAVIIMCVMLLFLRQARPVPQGTPA